MQPGRKDTTKSGTEKVQTRVLTDYMSNLHQKYLSNNSESKLSLATFCRIRPKYIHLTGCLSKNVCLCTKHQNVALKLQMMRNEGIDVSMHQRKPKGRKDPATRERNVLQMEACYDERQ